MKVKAIKRPLKQMHRRVDFWTYSLRQVKRLLKKILMVYNTHKKKEFTIKSHFFITFLVLLSQYSFLNKYFQT